MLFGFSDEFFCFAVCVLGDVELAVVDSDGISYEDVLHTDSFTDTSAEEDTVQIAIEKLDRLVARVKIEQEVFVMTCFVFRPFGEEGQFVAVVVLFRYCHV